MKFYIFTLENPHRIIYPNHPSIHASLQWTFETKSLEHNKIYNTVNKAVKWISKTISALDLIFVQHQQLSKKIAFVSNSIYLIKFFWQWIVSIHTRWGCFFGKRLNLWRYIWSKQQEELNGIIMIWYSPKYFYIFEHQPFLFVCPSLFSFLFCQLITKKIKAA